MTSKELSEIGRRYMLLRTELEQCPELMNDEDFMTVYNLTQRIYKHYHKHCRQVVENTSRVRKLGIQSSSTADTSRNWQGFIGDIRKYNDDGVI